MTKVVKIVKNPKPRFVVTVYDRDTGDEYEYSGRTVNIAAHRDVRTLYHMDSPTMVDDGLTNVVIALPVVLGSNYRNRRGKHGKQVVKRTKKSRKRSKRRVR